jgi:hypothetical protein
MNPLKWATSGDPSNAIMQLVSLHHHFYHSSTYPVLSLFICINSMPANIEPLSLITESTFDSFDQLLCYAQTYAKSAGYAFTTDKSELCKGRQVRLRSRHIHKRVLDKVLRN